MVTKNAMRYQLKVILNHIKPALWRRIVVPGSLTLWELHTVIQVVMDWQESHLHMFEIQNMRYGDPEDDETDFKAILDEHLFKVERVIPRKVGFRFDYTYDFGDTWEHVLLVEKILPAVEGENLPVCLQGMRAGALEDSGGPFGYMDLLAVLKDPEHPEHLDHLEWVGEGFDPEAFDLEDVNQRLTLLAENDYQIEELFEFDDEVDSDQAIAFSTWIFNLPDELKQACEALALRKDILTLLSYLRDHRVKGASITGNLPLKAVREITAQFVDPPDLNSAVHKVRSEEDVDDLLFVHTLAFGAGLLTGGPQQRWELTEDGLMFFELPPAAQLLQLFLTWSVRIRWTLNVLFAELENDSNPQGRLELIKQLAQQPAGEWLPFVPLAQQLTTAAGWQWPHATNPDHNQNMLTLGAFALVIVPMISFDAVEFRRTGENTAAYEHEYTEVRFTPLGSSLLHVVNEMIT